MARGGIIFRKVIPGKNLPLVSERVKKAGVKFFNRQASNRAFAQNPLLCFGGVRRLRGKEIQQEGKGGGVGERKGSCGSDASFVSERRNVGSRWERDSAMETWGGHDKYFEQLGVTRGKKA